MMKIGAKERGPPGGIATPFPVQLHNILSLAEAGGFAHLISCYFPSPSREMLSHKNRSASDAELFSISRQPNGSAFTVHDEDSFVCEVMPRFFSQTKFESFKRQIHLYGFSRIKIKEGETGISYRHDLFARDSPELCFRITRERAKTIREGKKLKLDKEEENNFDDDTTVSKIIGDIETLHTSNHYNQEADESPESYQAQTNVQNFKECFTDDDNDDDDGDGGDFLQNASINQGKTEESPLYSTAGVNDLNANESSQTLNNKTIAFNKIQEIPQSPTSRLWALSTANSNWTSCIQQTNTLHAMGSGLQSGFESRKDDSNYCMSHLLELRNGNNSNNSASQPRPEKEPAKLRQQDPFKPTPRDENFHQKRDVLDNDATSIGTIDVDWEVTSDCIVDEDYSISDTSCGEP